MSLAKLDICACNPSHYPSKRVSANGHLIARLHARRCLKNTGCCSGVNHRTYAFMDHMASNGKISVGPNCGWPSEKRADELNTLD